MASVVLLSVSGVTQKVTPLTSNTTDKFYGKLDYLKKWSLIPEDS